MGVSLEGKETPKEKVKYGEVFKQYFPIYLSYGMSASEFWDDDPELAAAYRKSYEISLNCKNLEMWMQGIYTMKALESTVGNMFKKKGDKPIEYPKEPLPITEKDVKALKEKQARQRFEEIKRRMILASKTVNRKERKDGEN